MPIAHLTNALSVGSNMIIPIENNPSTEVIQICTFNLNFFSSSADIPLSVFGGYLLLS